MKTRVEFKSSSFPKYENEDDETVNSNCWGKRLAEFIRDNLPRFGIETEDILCEDWGWMVNIRNEETARFALWIGCGPVDDYSEVDEEEDVETEATSHAEDSSPTEFCVFVTAEPGFFQRIFKKVDTQPAVSKVVEALEKLIAESDAFEDAVWCE